MGFRTVVVLNNDHPWQSDPELGQKIWQQVNRPDRYSDIQVLECTHADNTTLMSISFYGHRHEILAHDAVWAGDEKEQTVRLLKEAADKAGYRLVKKSK